MTREDIATWLTAHRGEFIGWASRRLRDPYEAEDAVAKVAESILRAASRIPDTTNARRYFSRALHWYTVQRRGVLHKQRLRTEDYQRDMLVWNSHGHKLREQRSALREALQRALTTLPKMTQVAVWRCYGYNEPKASVARALGIHYKTLSARLRAALKGLREHSALQAWKPK